MRYFEKTAEDSLSAKDAILPLTVAGGGIAGKLLYNKHLKDVAARNSKAMKGALAIVFGPSILGLGALGGWKGYTALKPMVQRGVGASKKFIQAQSGRTELGTRPYIGPNGKLINKRFI